MKKSSPKTIHRTAKSAHHFWAMEFALIGHTMPLIRILLILRKFRVGIIKMDIKQKTANHWTGSMILDYKLSTRTDTVFKKIAGLFDVAHLKYSQGKKLSKKAITLK